MSGAQGSGITIWVGVGASIEMPCSSSLPGSGTSTNLTLVRLSAIALGDYSRFRKTHHAEHGNLFPRDEHPLTGRHDSELAVVTTEHLLVEEDPTSVRLPIEVASPCEDPSTSSPARVLTRHTTGSPRFTSRLSSRSQPTDGRLWSRICFATQRSTRRRIPSGRATSRASAASFSSSRRRTRMAAGRTSESARRPRAPNASPMTTLRAASSAKASRRSVVECPRSLRTRGRSSFPRQR